MLAYSSWQIIMTRKCGRGRVEENDDDDDDDDDNEDDNDNCSCSNKTNSWELCHFCRYFDFLKYLYRLLPYLNDLV